MAPTLKDWLLAPVGKSDELANYLAQRRDTYRLRPPPDFTGGNFEDFSGPCAKRSSTGQSG